MTVSFVTERCFLHAFIQFSPFFYEAEAILENKSRTFESEEKKSALTHLLVMKDYAVRLDEHPESVDILPFIQMIDEYNPEHTKNTIFSLYDTVCTIFQSVRGISSESLPNVYYIDFNNSTTEDSINNFFSVEDGTQVGQILLISPLGKNYEISHSFYSDVLRSNIRFKLMIFYKKSRKDLEIIYENDNEEGTHYNHWTRYGFGEIAAEEYFDILSDVKNHHVMIVYKRPRMGMDLEYAETEYEGRSITSGYTGITSTSLVSASTKKSKNNNSKALMALKREVAGLRNEINELRYGNRAHSPSFANRYIDLRSEIASQLFNECSRSEYAYANSNVMGNTPSYTNANSRVGPSHQFTQKELIEYQRYTEAINAKGIPGCGKVLIFRHQRDAQPFSFITHKFFTSMSELKRMKLQYRLPDSKRTPHDVLIYLENDPHIFNIERCQGFQFSGKTFYIYIFFKATRDLIASVHNIFPHLIGIKGEDDLRSVATTNQDFSVKQSVVGASTVTETTSFYDGGTSHAASSIDPSSVVPSSIAPSSVAPSSIVPSSVAPSSIAPSSVVPSSIAPSSVVPSSIAPSSVAPSGIAPSSVAPSSIAPSSVVPSSIAPSSVVPSSIAPSSVVPSSIAPSSIVPYSQQGLQYPWHAVVYPQQPVLYPQQGSVNTQQDPVYGQQSVVQSQVSGFAPQTGVSYGPTVAPITPRKVNQRPASPIRRSNLPKLSFGIRPRDPSIILFYNEYRRQIYTETAEGNNNKRTLKEKAHVYFQAKQEFSPNNYWILKVYENKIERLPKEEKIKENGEMYVVLKAIENACDVIVVDEDYRVRFFYKTRGNVYNYDVAFALNSVFMEVGIKRFEDIEGNPYRKLIRCFSQVFVVIDNPLLTIRSPVIKQIVYGDLVTVQ